MKSQGRLLLIGLLSAAGAAMAAEPPAAAAPSGVTRGFTPGIAPPVPNSRENARYGDPAHTDFSGLWASDRLAALVDYTQPLPLTRSYAVKLREHRRRVDIGDQPEDVVNQCIALGMPRFMAMQFEVLQTPGQVTMIADVLDDVRRIYTDGSGPTINGESSFNGHSAGRWEDAELVVETTDLKAGTMDAFGTPYSDKLSIVERWKLLAPGKLQITFTLTDPEAFTRPWTLVNTYSLLPIGTRFEQYACENKR
jgi:hypothetical protein